MSNIQKAVELAFKVFSPRNRGVLTNDSLTELKNYVDKITKKELNINQSLLEEGQWTENDPPVTYVRVLENNEVLTVAMFILRPGKRLPLHDHPRMHGFLKVIHGQVNIQTYTPLDPNAYPIPQSISHDLQSRYNMHIPVYPMMFEGSRIVSESDECCVLTPDGKNIHEISSEKTAAFLDILSPPYSHDRENENYRPCSYFKELQQDIVNSSIRYLARIRPPSEYWCDEAAYTGPPLLNQENETSQS